MSSVISVLRSIQQKKTGGLIMSNKMEKGVVAKVIKGKQVKYVISDPKSKDTTPLKIDNMNYIVEPHIPISEVERWIAFLSGQSGTGKTAIASLLIGQYAYHYNKNVYYVCETKLKDDINLKKLTYIKQIPTDSLEDIKIEQLRNSLVFIDDIDYSPNHKQCMKFINMIVETGRKFGTSLIFASHVNTKGGESCIYKELSLYFTNYNNTANNRLIEKYLNLSRTQIDKIQNHRDSAFICVNKVFDCIITDKIIEKI